MHAQMTDLDGPGLASHGERAPETRSRLVRAGAVALLVSGPANLAFHALWRIGHGSTVVNEHREVLGLTNDEWSYLGTVWLVGLAVGVAAVCSLHRGRLRVIAGALTLAGLGLAAAAKWVWPLYSVGALAQYAGMLALAVMVLRGRVLSRAAGAALLVAVLSFLPVPVAPDLVYSTLPTGLPVPFEGQDVVVLCESMAWIALALALRRVTPGVRTPRSR